MLQVGQFRTRSRMPNVVNIYASVGGMCPANRIFVPFVYLSINVILKYHWSDRENFQGFRSPSLPFLIVFHPH
jgi:hypothetical protein